MRGAFEINDEESFVELDIYGRGGHQVPREEEDMARRHLRAKLCGRVSSGMKSARRRVSLAMGKVSRQGTAIKDKIKTCARILSVKRATPVDLHHRDVAREESPGSDDLLIPESGSNISGGDSATENQQGTADKSVSHLLSMVEDDVIPSLVPTEIQGAACTIAEGIRGDEQASTAEAEQEILAPSVLGISCTLSTQHGKEDKVKQNLSDNIASEKDSEGLEETKARNELKHSACCGVKEAILSRESSRVSVPHTLWEGTTDDETGTRKGFGLPAIFQEEDSSGSLSTDRSPGIQRENVEIEIPLIVNSIIEEVLESVKPMSNASVASSAAGSLPQTSAKDGSAQSVEGNSENEQTSIDTETVEEFECVKHTNDFARPSSPIGSQTKLPTNEVAGHELDEDTGDEEILFLSGIIEEVFDSVEQKNGFKDSSSPINLSTKATRAKTFAYSIDENSGQERISMFNDVIEDVDSSPVNLSTTATVAKEFAHSIDVNSGRISTSIVNAIVEDVLDSVALANDAASSSSSTDHLTRVSAEEVIGEDGIEQELYTSDSEDLRKVEHVFDTTSNVHNSVNEVEFASDGSHFSSVDEPYEKKCDDGNQTLAGNVSHLRGSFKEDESGCFSWGGQSGDPCENFDDQSTFNAGSEVIGNSSITSNEPVDLRMAPVHTNYRVVPNLGGNTRCASDSGSWAETDSSLEDVCLEIGVKEFQLPRDVDQVCVGENSDETDITVQTMSGRVSHTRIIFHLILFSVLLSHIVERAQY